MKISDQNTVWHNLILNPGQAEGLDEEVGLDARLLESMITSGVIPKDILEQKIVLEVKNTKLPAHLMNLLQRRFEGDLRSVPGLVELPLWVPWLCRRESEQKNEKAHQSIELMHKLGLVPWGKQLFEDGLNVYGLDVVFPLSWGRKWTQTTNTILDLALEATPEKDKEGLKARGLEHCGSWVATAKRSWRLAQFEVMNKHGLWSSSNNPGLSNDTFDNFKTGEMILAALEAGGDPIAARIQVSSLYEDTKIGERVELLEKIDQVSDEIAGRPTRSSAADKAINLIAAKSAAIDEDSLVRLFKKKTPKHRNGMGLGLSMMAAATRGKENVSLMVENLENRGSCAPQWEPWKAQEAAGMEGTGITEGQCLLTARILGGTLDAKYAPSVGDFNSLLEKLDKQTVVSLPWERFRWHLYDTALWREWAMDPQADPNSPIRKRMGNEDEDTWTYEGLTNPTDSFPFDMSVYDRGDTAQKLMVATGAAIAAMENNDLQARDWWAGKAMEKWATILITSCMSDNTSEDDVWDGPTGKQQALVGLDPIEWAKKIPDCQTFQDRLAEFVSFLDRSMEVEKSTGYRAGVYSELKNAKPQISPIEFITVYAPTMMGDDMPDSTEKAISLMKRFYLMAKQMNLTLVVQNSGPQAAEDRGRPKI